MTDRPRPLSEEELATIVAHLKHGMFPSPSESERLVVTLHAEQERYALLDGTYKRMCGYLEDVDMKRRKAEVDLRTARDYTEKLLYELAEENSGPGSRRRQVFEARPFIAAVRTFLAPPAAQEEK